MRTYIKQSEGFEGFMREVKCYELLNFSKHVPTLISKNIKKWKLEIAWAGDSVQQLQWQNKKVKVHAMHQQLNQIAQDFSTARVMHLDANIGNLCILDGHLFVIDFEKTCINGNPESHKLNKRYRKLMRQGGYTRLVQNWVDMLETVML